MHYSLEALVEKLEREKIIKRKEVKEAFLKVDRRDFVREDLKDKAYLDMPLPIVKDATISAPHMHAIYLEELELKKDDKFLEIGFGSGILLAYAYEITKREVYGIEIDKDVFEFGKRNLEKTNYIDKCKIFLRDGKYGLEEYSPFDKIAVSAATKEISPFWVNQLKDNGILLVPIIENFNQKLYKIKKIGKRIEKKFICYVSFIELK
ncbi:MAG: protein-L-isoaspartate O-methyltransferase [Candidatus Aenigmatarchaeota archaeon]|nr:protein-L-isoaspartate O-methyltransferase [Candidatus Aenigmarchaeota archaeon]